LHEVLPKKNEKYKRYAPLLRMADAAANLPNALRLSFYKAGKSSSLQFIKVTEIRYGAQRLYSFQDFRTVLSEAVAVNPNCIKQYPWLIESGPTEESRRYHFSSVAHRFENICVKITADGKLKGFLHLTIRDGHLKVPYAFFEKENLSDIVEYVYGIMLSQKLNMLTVFQKNIVAYLKIKRYAFHIQA
jgi:hypothetical protein